jgi:hypothetical protein
MYKMQSYLQRIHINSPSHSTFLSTATLLKTDHEAKTSKVNEKGCLSIWEKLIAKKDNV